MLKEVFDLKKLAVIALLALGILGTFTSAYAFGNVRCPHCGIDGCMWTGETQSDAYGMFLVYECINGHRFLVRQ
jgi:hypothetical protein